MPGMFTKAIYSVQFCSDWTFCTMGFICNSFNYCLFPQMSSSNAEWIAEQMIHYGKYDSWQVCQGALWVGKIETNNTSRVNYRFLKSRSPSCFLQMYTREWSMQKMSHFTYDSLCAAQKCWWKDNVAQGSSGGISSKLWCYCQRVSVWTVTPTKLH